MIYKKIESFDRFKNNIIENGDTFIIEETTYSKKIIIGESEIMFNKNGKKDQKLLKLINMVRNDAIGFRGEIGSSHVHYNDLIREIPDGVVSKIDISGAYWKQAMMIGLVSDETNKYLIESYPETKPMKSARLKALGSLATKKIFRLYENGKEIEQKIKKQPTREIYIEICRAIDSLMREICVEIPGAFFYYTDCIFTSEKYTNDVVAYIREKKFSTTVEKTTINTVQIGKAKYIITNEGEKMYAVRKEKEFLLKPNNFTKNMFFL